MPEQFDSIYFRGQGPLFIGDRDSSGNPTGLIFVGDVGEVSATPAIEKEEINENVSGQGLLGASYRRATKYNLSITLRSVKPEHLSQAIQGSNTAKTAASVTDEAHTAYQDKMVPLEHNKVSAVVVTGSGGSPSYVADTDYVVHADEGLIEILSTGSIGDASAIEVDYDYAAQHHVKANPQQGYKYLLFAGKNSANNDKQTRCELYKVELDPAVLGLIQETGFGTPQINGTILVDTLRTAGDQLYSWKVED